MIVSTKLTLGILIALAIAGFVTVSIVGGAEGDDFAQRPIEKSGSSRDLVVLIHALMSSPDDLKHVRAVVSTQYPDADIFTPSYTSDILANTSPRDLAAKLDRRLEKLCSDAQQQGHPYRKIILVGHSIGALVARRAYLYGKGYRSDHPNPELQQLKPTQGEAPRAWTTLVDRVVLLAGMNRGWDMRRIDNRSWLKQFTMRSGTILGRTTGTGKLALSIERGAPFIGNLRIDWLRMTNQEQGAVSPVIQLLGERDDFVTPGDDLDAITAPNFVFIRVDDSGHTSIREMDPNTPPGRHRAEVFARAVSEPIEQLKTKYKANDKLLNQDSKIKHVVFIKHGIRDMADWSTPLRWELENSSDQVHVVIEKFPYFSMMSFLLLWDRQSEVRRFVDEYATAVARFPNAESFSFVGHSFGTYIAASAIERYRSIIFDRLYFAGSVVRRDFEWNRYKQDNRFTAIRNDRAAADWVVAIFPRFFEQLRSMSGLNHADFLDVGSAGFNGFINSAATEYDYKYLEGGHGVALAFDHNKDQARNIAQFILSPQLSAQAGPANLLDKPNDVVRFLGQLAWLVWVTLAALMLAGALFVWRSKLFRSQRPLALLAYAVLIVVALNTF